MKRYIRSSSEVLIPAFQKGDDYTSRKAMIDDVVGRFVSKGNSAVVSDPTSSIYYILSPGLDNHLYRITEMKNDKPIGHESGNSITKLLEDYFVSHLEIQGEVY